MLSATAACTCSTSQLQKVLRTWCVLYILACMCASRHSGVHFFNISISRSGARASVFNILTSKCASRHNGVHFVDVSTSQSAPTLVCFAHFDFETCFAPQCVQFLISHLARWLRTRRFSEPTTFRSSRATNHWKNTVNRDFSTSSCTCVFFILTLSLLLFFLLIFLFSLPLPCSSSVHIVGSLTSKLPSAINYI